MSKLFSAFATADLRTLYIASLPTFGVNFKIAIASATFLPRMRFMTTRTLRGAMRTFLATAFASTEESSFQSDLSKTGLSLFTGMALKSTGWCKLTKLVANHVLGYINRHMLAAIMYCDSVTNKSWQNSGASGPGLYNLLVVSFIQGINLLS